MRTFLLRGKNFLSLSGAAERRESSIVGYLLREVGRGKWRLIPRRRNNVRVVRESALPDAAQCVLGVPNYGTVTRALVRCIRLDTRDVEAFLKKSTIAYPPYPGKRAKF